jgi:hypothetical protein
MASLALFVALLVFSLWGLALACVSLSLLGRLRSGAVLGCVSAIAGLWLVFVLPYAPFVGLLNVLAGVFSVAKYIRSSE